MGRVIDVHPGTDGYVRVVSLNTKNGIIKRPVLKLSIPPVKDEEPQQTAGDAQSSPKDDVTPADTQTTQQRPRRTTRKPLGTFISMAMMLFMLLFSKDSVHSTYRHSMTTKTFTSIRCTI